MAAELDVILNITTDDSYLPELLKVSLGQDANKVCREYCIDYNISHYDCSRFMRTIVSGLDTLYMNVFGVEVAPKTGENVDEISDPLSFDSNKISSMYMNDNDLLPLSENNFLMLQLKDGDYIEKEMNATMDDELVNNLSTGYFKQPLNLLWIHGDKNNLGDQFTAYLFHYYAIQNNYARPRRHVYIQQNISIVSAVGSTIQWLMYDKLPDYLSNLKSQQSAQEYIHDQVKQFPDTYYEAGIRALMGLGLISSNFSNYYKFDDKESRSSRERLIEDDPRLEFIGVRGPLTQKALLTQINKYVPVISDPGLLASRIYRYDPITHTILPPKTEKDKASYRWYGPKRPVGFVIHEADRKLFRQMYPELQELIIDNHVFTNAHSFFAIFNSYERIVSSSLHGIVFAHAYGIPVYPIGVTRGIFGNNFKYKDYYHSVGHIAFEGRERIPFDIESVGLGSVERKWLLIGKFARLVDNYWQPDPVMIRNLQDMQEAIIKEYLSNNELSQPISTVSTQICYEPFKTVQSIPQEERKMSRIKDMLLHEVTLQEFHLREGIAEMFENKTCVPECIFRTVTEMDKNLTSGTFSFHKDNVTVSLDLIFAMRLVQRVRFMSEIYGKQLTLNFIGALDIPQRAWIRHFEQKVLDNGNSMYNTSFKSYIASTTKGRSFYKYRFDYNYYEVVAMSNFTLCPPGDFPWSYRIFEAIMGMSIPIVHSQALDEKIVREGYFYYTYDYDEGSEELVVDGMHVKTLNISALFDQLQHRFVYDYDKALQNYELLIQNHVFSEEHKTAIRDKVNCV